MVPETEGDSLNVVITRSTKELAPHPALPAARFAEAWPSATAGAEARGAPSHSPAEREEFLRRRFAPWQVRKS